MIGTLRKGFIDEGGRSETKTDQALRLRNLRGNFLSQSENLHPCDPEPQKLRRACEMENIARAGYNNMNTYEYQRQTYVSNYLDGLNRGETCEKMKLQSPPHLINVQYPIEENEHDASLHLKMPTENSFNSNRYITTRPTVSPSWTSTEYPRHGFAYCDSSRAFVERAAESVSPSCMFSSPRALYQHYINHPGSQMQWIHDLSQDPTMRSRPSFTSHQTRELEQEFNTCQYVSRRRRIEIAYALNLTEKQIKTWFQNRRVKERKTRKPGDHKEAL
eukprot:Seg2077.1 transcript_id=Seg2077.1/GoldUCD/mRNA.D3Y31 product="Homeobox protein Hox-A4" protein_id=Seg2077.1/GoldUCD/D3Y31